MADLGTRALPVPGLRGARGARGASRTRGVEAAVADEVRLALVGNNLIVEVDRQSLGLLIPGVLQLATGHVVDTIVDLEEQAGRLCVEKTHGHLARQMAHAAWRSRGYVHR